MKNNADIILDIYIAGEGGSHATHGAINELEKSFKVLLKFPKIEKQTQEKDYGWGASWAVTFIEWLNNNYLTATLTLVELIRLGKKLIDLIKKSQAKNKNRIYLGPKSAQYVGLYYLSKIFIYKNFSTLLVRELERGEFGTNKKEFVVIFEEILKPDEQKKHGNYNNDDKSIIGKLITLHLDWEGNLINLNSF